MVTVFSTYSQTRPQCPSITLITGRPGRIALTRAHAHTLLGVSIEPPPPDYSAKQRKSPGRLLLRHLVRLSSGASLSPFGPGKSNQPSASLTTTARGSSFALPSCPPRPRTPGIPSRSTTRLAPYYSRLHPGIFSRYLLCCVSRGAHLLATCHRPQEVKCEGPGLVVWWAHPPSLGKGEREAGASAHTRGKGRERVGGVWMIGI